MVHWKNHPKSVLLALLALQVLAQIDRNMLVGFSQVITQELALSHVQYGFLVGAVWVFSFGLMALSVGTLADYHSRFKILGLGMVVWSLCTAASGMALSFNDLAIARLLVACGEATLVPIGVSLLAELFDEKKRGVAIGIFFMGIPLGLGSSFFLAGSIGVDYGWRSLFYAFGVLGLITALPVLLLKEEPHHERVRGQAPSSSIRSFFKSSWHIWLLVKQTPTLSLTIIGFILIHFSLVSLAFVQLWIAYDLGASPAAYSKQLGLLQMAVGICGSVFGGILSDKLADKLPGGRAGLVVFLITLCAPLMILCRFSTPGSLLFFTGLCAGIFLSMACYGPTISIIQQLTPNHQRSGITGFCMLWINVIAIAFGSAFLGWLSDKLIAAQVPFPLTRVLLTSDVLAISSVVFFLITAIKLSRTTDSSAR